MWPARWKPDAGVKENFAPADPHAVLARLVDLPVQSWNYKAEGPGVKRLGPTAQDFYAAFGLGSDDKHISGVDAHGVAFLAIQALYRVVQEKAAGAGPPGRTRSAARPSPAA